MTQNKEKKIPYDVDVTNDGRTAAVAQGTVTTRDPRYNFFMSNQ